jgi:acyl-CoA thioesterase
MSEKVFEAIRRKVEKEPYAKKLGLKLRKLAAGYSLVEMTMTEDVENIFGRAHGGAIFSLIDEAFQTAANSHGTIAVALQVTISYLKPPRLGAKLLAEAREVSGSRRIGHYEVDVKDEKGELVARSVAMAYRMEDPLPFLAETS